MREIKFRAWSKSKQCLLNMNDSYAWSTKEINKHTINEINKPITDYIWMQYTGLKDKNGKEIFDDDIVEAPHDFGPSGFSVRRFRVVFHNELGYQWQYWLMDEAVVIGNVHENPELLQQENAA